MGPTCKITRTSEGLMLSRAICQAQRLFQSLPLYKKKKKVKKDLKGKEGGKHFKALSSGIAESWFELDFNSPLLFQVHGENAHGFWFSLEPIFLSFFSLFLHLKLDPL